MRADGRGGRSTERSERNRGERGQGVPDSLLIGVLCFLLGMTTLVWLATGLSGLFARGRWPVGVTFTRTPMALRELVGKPHDLATAWPDTPAEQLSGYGLFWGILISELMVLLVLTIFAMGTAARFRVVRANRREKRRWTATAAPAGDGSAQAPVAAPVAVPVAEPEPEDAPVDAPVDVSAAEPGEAAVDLPVAEPGETATESAATAVGAAFPGQRSGSADVALPRVHFGADRAIARQATLTAISGADGPLVVATTDPAVWTETKDARAKLGPVFSYDPLHLLDTPARVRWTPTVDCEDIAVAADRATALLAPVRPMSALDSALADAAETLLRCWLHAAAVEGRPFRQLQRWAHGGGTAHEPVRILRTNPRAAAGRAGELESILTAHAERRDMAQQLVARALAALSSVHIRNACNPGRADALALESFLSEGGTLYVVGESIEDPRTAAGAMPLLTALLSSVVERGRRMAERSSDGRLDPPLTLVLDDIAALAPLPALPYLLETGGTQGLLTLATMRSQEQARSRWPGKVLAL